MSAYVAAASKISTLPQAPTSHNKEHQYRAISAAQVKKMKVHQTIPISGIKPSEDSSIVQSRKRTYHQVVERPDNATSNNKALSQTYASVPAKRICRENVTAMTVDNQNSSVLKQTSGLRPATAVPVVSLQRNLSSLVPKESPAFVSTATVPILLVPVQLIMHHQQQAKNVLPTTLPEQQDGVQPTSVPPTAIQLEQEIKVLKERKKDLLHRLSLFHQLFRNKERLEAVVRRLVAKSE